MTEIDRFLPQEALLTEVTDNEVVEVTRAEEASPLPWSESDDVEIEELKKACEEDATNGNDAEPPKTDHTLSSCKNIAPASPTEIKTSSTPSEKRDALLSPTPTKTPTKSPKLPRKGTSPDHTRVFSPDEHKKRLSQFKLREMEKKSALEERRKKQADEMEKKRVAIMKKHEAADRRLQERNRASPRKLGAFGSTVQSRSAMSLNLNDKQIKRTGSTQNLTSPKVQLRPQSATPCLKRPVSMGALPTSGPVHTGSIRKSLTPVPRATQGNVSQPVIKQNKKDDDKKNTIKKKVDIKNLMKPTKVSNFTALGKKPKSEDESKPSTRQRASSFNRPRASSLNKPTAKMPTTSKPATAAPKTSAPKARRSSVGKAETRQQTPPLDSPSKSVMNSATQAKVNQQEEAKLRLEEARKKAREEKARKDEEERRLAEERRIEEERKRAEAEEARLRMLKEKELRKKQIEEEAERARLQELERVEQEQKEQEERVREEQDRLEQQREEHEAIQSQRRKAEEERMAKEEDERRERQKKLDAILKRSSVKFDTAPKREISANASAILAKHNITLNLPSVPKSDAVKEEHIAPSSKQDNVSENEEVNSREPSENTSEEIPQQDNQTENTREEIPQQDNQTDNSSDEKNNLLIDFSDNGVVDHLVSDEPSNNFTTLEEVTTFNGETRVVPDQELLIRLSDDKPLNNDYIENNNDSSELKEANEFTIGITSPEELQLSNVL